MIRGYEEVYKYNFTSDTLYYGNAEPISWSDISHVNYTDPEFPTPPLYTIYTGMNSETAFIIFSSLWLIQIICIWVKNLCKSESFCELSFLDQFIHVFHCVIMPIPSLDWETGKASKGRLTGWIGFLYKSRDLERDFVNSADSGLQLIQKEQLEVS